MASRTLASLSRHRTKLSRSIDGAGCGTGGGKGAATTAATRGTVMEKIEPSPGAERTVISTFIISASRLQVSGKEWLR
mgnify:CR=1 FL=1